MKQTILTIDHRKLILGCLLVAQAALVTGCGQTFFLKTRAPHRQLLKQLYLQEPEEDRVPEFVANRAFEQAIVVGMPRAEAERYLRRNFTDLSDHIRPEMMDDEEEARLGHLPFLTTRTFRWQQLYIFVEMRFWVFFEEDRVKEVYAERNDAVL